MHHSTLRRRIIGVLAALVLAFSGHAADPFSIVLIPDTQYYTTQPSYDIYDHQMQWIVNNENTYNIQFVVHLGDMTNNNTATQWSIARDAFDILDAASIPYSVLPGNHDYFPANTLAFRSTLINSYFPPSSFAGKSWYGGNKGETSTNNENNYCFFEVGDLKFMILSLEVAPRKETLTWANDLISQYPDRRVIIATHIFLTNGGAYADGANNSYGVVGVGGSQLFDELISRHSNVFLATCGHVTESELNTKTGVGGNTIYEMLVDYQSEKPLNTGSNLGNGWLRVLEFDPDTNTVDAFTITVEAGNTNIFSGGNPVFYNTGKYSSDYTASDHLFSFPYDMTPLGEYHYLNSSTNIHDFTVNNVGGDQQRDSDVAVDEDGNFAVVWESDPDGNGVFDVRLRLFDSDGNALANEQVVNTIGVNSTTAMNAEIGMAPDGRFAVVFQAGSEVYARVYNAAGSPNGSEFVVPTTTGGTKRNPDVKMADDGDFVVVWEDDADGNGWYQIKGRGFNYNKTQKFGQKTVNSFGAGDQLNPEISMAGNGDYVVCWDDDQDKDGNFWTAVRAFNENETEKVAQFFANTGTTGQHKDGDVAMDDNGRFVVTWEADGDGNGFYQIKARGFNGSGSQIIPEFTVNDVATGNQINPDVSMDSESNFYIVWQDDYFGEGGEFLSQGFTISGTKLYTNDIIVNSATDVTNDNGSEERRDPAITTHDSGRSIVTWTDDQDGNGYTQILARGLTNEATKLAVKVENGLVAVSPDKTFYNTGESVTLTVTPDTGYSFVSWEGDVPSGSETNNPLTVTMNSTRKLQAIIENNNPPADVIVDNNTVDFTASANWNTGSFGSSYYGPDYQWRSTQATSDMALWNVDLPNSGSYEVFARWTTGGNRSLTAPYFIYHNGGTAVVNVNQQANDGTWVSLGTYNFNSGASNKIGLSCWTTAGYVVIADAVRFIEQ